MAETIQEMIARKRREKAEGEKPKVAVDNAAARAGMNTEVSTAERGTAREFNKNLNGYEGRATISLQDSKTKDVQTEKSTGQKLLEDRKKRAQAKAYVEANSK